MPTSTMSRAPIATFADLPLDPDIIRELHRQRLTTPFAIQAAALPDALAGRDVLGRGRTGSGKTLAFGLALLTRLAGRRAAARRPLALILAPTRELAQQVTAALRPYAEAVDLRCTTVVGGLPIRSQINALSSGVEIMVATPGRLADLINGGHCRLDRVEITVVDEADQMADIGFLPQVSALLDRVPSGGQRMLFSATLDRGVDVLVRRFLVDPVTHRVDPPAATITTMAHHLLQVESTDKQATVTEIAGRKGRVIMFVGTQRRANQLAQHLLGYGVATAALHGGKSQGQRTRALEQFKAGTLNVLVATNVAARGIHIEGLDLVVNVDPPADGKDYLHRGGRTARAGQTGTVVTLVLPEQRHEVRRLMATAGVRAEYAAVHPGHPELVRLTGARTISRVAAAAGTVDRDVLADRGTRADRGPRTGRAGRATSHDTPGTGRDARGTHAVARVTTTPAADGRGTRDGRGARTTARTPARTPARRP